MSPGNSQRAFTLAELVVGSTLAAIVMAGVLSSFVFLGRNLTRISYQHALEAKSRIALGYLTADLKLATDVQSETSPSSPSDTRLKLKFISSTNTTYYVTYAYDSTNKYLTRQVDSGTAVTLLADTAPNGQKVITCTSFDFNYYTTTSGTPTSQSTTTLVPYSIKLVEVSYTLESGSAANGTKTQLQIASARFALRNRALPTGS